MRRLQDQVGFSMLELVVVLLVLGVVCVVACPVYASQRSKAEDVLLVANARNLVTPVAAGWADVQSAGPTSLSGSIVVARQWLAKELADPREAGAGLHFVNPCTGSDRVVDADRLPSGDISPAVWITSSAGFDSETFRASDATVARLRGSIIVDYVVDAQQRRGHIEVFSVDRDGRRSAAVQTIPMAD